METLHNQVWKHLGDMTSKYKEKENETMRRKDFFVGDELMVYLRRERFPIGTYNNLNMRKFEPCKILSNLDSKNVYEVELLETLDISLIFNIVDIYKYCEGY
jgi:hypothetical protein